MSQTQSIHLEISDADGGKSRLRVPGPRVMLGRAAESQVRLDRATVSRRHAEIHCDPYGRWWVRDLGSRNRTVVNGEPITERALHRGDMLHVGEFSLRVLGLDGAGSAIDLNHTVAGDGPMLGPVAVAAGEGQSISRLREIESPRIVASHVSDLTDFGQQLLQVESPRARFALLCELLVRPAFHGRCAMALRVDKSASPPQPQMLVEPAAAPGWKEQKPYISQTVLRAVLQREEPLVAGNTHAMSEHAMDVSIAPSLMPLAAVACPLASDDQHLDLLYVILPPEYGTGEWLALAALATRQFQQAQAVWAGRAHREAHVAIERELEQARQIQSRLVPRPLTIRGLDVAVGFRPCKWVGGDYVDVIRTTGGRVLLTLADVCGKGLAAAMVASGLHTTIRLAARLEMDLPHLVQNLNEHLIDALPQGSFVTMACALVDPATGDFQCVNAGHPAPLLLGPGDTMCSCQCSTNLPLGLSTDAMEFQTGTLGSGQMLVLYSDGLIDLLSPDGKRLGADGLAHQVQKLFVAHGRQPAQELADRFSAVLDEVESGAALADDRTFLLAKRL